MFEIFKSRMSLDKITELTIRLLFGHHTAVKLLLSQWTSENFGSQKTLYFMRRWPLAEPSSYSIHIAAPDFLSWLWYPMTFARVCFLPPLCFYHLYEISKARGQMKKFSHPLVTCPSGHADLPDGVSGDIEPVTIHLLHDIF
jgi:hypothetical protein